MENKLIIRIHIATKICFILLSGIDIFSCHAYGLYDSMYGDGTNTRDPVAVILRPLVHLKFDNGSLADSGTLGIALTPIGAPTTTTGKDGDANGAYLYGGTNYFSTATNGDAGLPMGASPRTMCAWVNPSAQPALQAIRYGNIWGTYSASALGIASISGIPNIAFNGYFYDAYTPYTVPLNTWSHLCVAFIAGTAGFYVNGSFIASPTFSSAGPLNTSPGSFVIGTWDGLSTSNWQGVIDDVQIYGIALSATQIYQIYSTGMTY